MPKKSLTLILILILNLSLKLSAQPYLPKEYPKGYFRYPLNLPIRLNANFGEMRPNHYHMGLDLFTNRVENQPVYAPADGYISRIKIESGGFGRALYINYPNGLTTLFAHMNRFIPQVEAYLEEEQYKQERWSLELYIPPGKFPVKKGQLVGYSGNTGASAGPHVHFEIRKTENDNCLNPLLFGFNLKDVTPPDIQKLMMYDRNRSTYEQAPVPLTLVKTGTGKYRVSGGVVNTNSNSVSFAIAAIDRITGVPNQDGLYEATLLLDGEPISGFELDDISYSETRYQNAHIDYKKRAEGGAYFQHLTPLPGNKLNIYQKWNEDGLIHLRDTAVHVAEIRVKDAYGNESRIGFRIQNNDFSEEETDYPENKDNRWFLPGQVNIFDQDDVQVYISESGLYDAIRFNYNWKASNGYSKIHVLHTPVIPLHDSMIVSIKPDKSVPPELENKMLMVKTARGRTEVAKANYNRGWYDAKFREFGEFRLEADDEPPTISAIGLKEGSTLIRNSRIVIIVKDNFDEINDFRAELDGNWLMFSRSGNHFYYRVDEHCPVGKHELKIIAEDVAGNLAEKTFNFFRR